MKPFGPRLDSEAMRLDPEFGLLAGPRKPHEDSGIAGILPLVSGPQNFTLRRDPGVYGLASIDDSS